MNAIFNIDRYWKFEQRNLFLSKTQYLYIAKGLIILYILSMLMEVLVQTNLSGIIYLLSGALIITAPCFLEKSITKNASVFDLILPVSSFERFLSFWLKYILIIPAFLFSIILVLNLLTGLIPVEEIQTHAADMSLTDHILKNRMMLNIYVTQSIFMVGYFYFKRYAFAKTTLILLLGLVSFMLLFILFSYKSIIMNLDASSQNQTFEAGYQLGQSISIKSLSFLNNQTIKVADTIADIALSVGLWIVCYFKLRETEI